MRLLTRTVATLSLFGLGVLAGSQMQSLQTEVKAQSDAAAAGADAPPSDEVKKQVLAANTALMAAKTALAGEQRYNIATKSLNVSMILAGGVDAVADLEAGRGVDPETFAALYAGDAKDEIAAELATDEQGRLTYKNKVVRMYPVSRLKALYRQRVGLVGAADEKSEPIAQ